MKNLFSWLIIFSVAAGGAYYVKISLPCARPIQYTIGAFDKRFDITQTELLTYLDNASDLWSEGANKELFVYDPHAKLAVNLIYDERQATTERNKVTRSVIDETTQSAESVKAEFTRLEAEYDEQLTEYKRLVAERKNFSAIERKRQEVNTLANEINALIKKYNSLVGAANENIKIINQTAEEEFNEGEYISDDEGRRINIYEFENEVELTRLLAHELGHALGLQHTDNTKSIMYYLNQSTNETLTSEDLVALRTLCGL